jgi:hypothetical protein
VVSYRTLVEPPLEECNRVDPLAGEQVLSQTS